MEIKRDTEKEFIEFIEKELCKSVLSSEAIAQKLGLDDKEVAKLLKKNRKNYKIFTLPDKEFRPVYRAVSTNLLLPQKIMPPLENKELNVRCWTPLPIEKLYPGRKARIPLLFVQVDADFPKLKIYFLADFHFGGEGFEKEGFNKCISIVANKDHALMVAVGDLVEMALASSVPGAIYGQKIRPRDQIEQFREEIKPVAHKCLLILPGNHESRVIKATDIDPLKLGICDYYGIPYYNEPAIMVISWKEHFFTFYFRHGKSGALTPGGKLNAAARPLIFLPHIQFITMAHVHTPTGGINIRRCRNYVYDQKGNLIDFSIKNKEEHIVICSSTHRYFESYSAREEYSPVVTSIAEAAVLYPDGRYHLETKLLK